MAARDLLAAITRNRVRIIRPQGNAFLDDLRFFKMDKRGQNFYGTALDGRFGPGIDSSLHRPNKLEARVRIGGGIDGVEPTDNRGNGVCFCPGHSQREENRVAEGDIGWRNA